MATHSNILAQRIPMDRRAWWAAVLNAMSLWSRTLPLPIGMAQPSPAVPLPKSSNWKADHECEPEKHALCCAFVPVYRRCSFCLEISLEFFPGHVSNDSKIWKEQPQGKLPFSLLPCVPAARLKALQQWNFRGGKRSQNVQKWHQFSPPRTGPRMRKLWQSYFRKRGGLPPCL